MHIGRHLIRSLSTASSAVSNIPERLAGSAPSHRLYVFLNHDASPQTFPPKLMTAAQRALLLQINKEGGLSNLAWSPEHSGDAPAAIAFSPYGRLDLPEVNVANIAGIVPTLLAHAKGEVPVSKSHLDKIWLYVCTHGARDCRCGDRGGAVVQALRDELKSRPAKDQARVQISEVGHVGGHVFAANLLCYTSHGGDW